MGNFALEDRGRNPKGTLVNKTRQYVKRKYVLTKLNLFQECQIDLTLAINVIDHIERIGKIMQLSQKMKKRTW